MSLPPAICPSDGSTMRAWNRTGWRGRERYKKMQCRLCGFRAWQYEDGSLGVPNKRSLAWQPKLRVPSVPGARVVIA